MLTPLLERAGPRSDVHLAAVFQIEHHTADVRVRIRASSFDELFRDAVAALMEILGAQPSGPAVQRTVGVDAADATALVVDFLNEVLGLALVHREMYEEVRFESLSESSLAATLEGREATFGDEVKAVTYHEADVHQEVDGMWVTTLVFDI